MSTSINTSTAGPLEFTPGSFVERIYRMLRIIITIACAMQLVSCIIVKDEAPGHEYKYAYEVEDPTTGDRKSQHEERRGQLVRGDYSLLAPDGIQRTVHYVADGQHGFQAVVTEEKATIPFIYQHNEAAFEEFPHTVFENAPLTYDMYPYNLPAVHAQTLAEYMPLVRLSKGEAKRYFTPANELPSGKAPLKGTYFEPNQ